MADLGVIIITGGAQRLGLACAQSLVSQGYRVIITYRQERAILEELRAIGVRCMQVDFSDKGQLEGFIETIKKEYSSLRGIIHNASQWQTEEGSDDLSLLMETMWQVHVFAPYRMNLAFEGLLCAQDESGVLADIIHLTDYVVEKGAHKHIAYGASKAGLANLTCSFAKRLAPNVKVNTIAPSLLMFNEEDDASYREKALNKSLLQREAGIEEGVLAINYILQSHYITGRTLSLDGGRHLV